MAQQGSLYLDMAALIGVYDQVKAYEDTVLDAFYSQYKSTFKISKSNYFRGDAADAFKQYITEGEINILCEFMDVASDMTMISQLMAEAFYQYETNHSGKVAESVLDHIDSELATKSSTFDGAVSELDSAVTEAANYIDTTPLQYDQVTQAFSDTVQKVTTIRENLYTVDSESTTAVKELLERITALKTLIDNVVGHCYSGDTLDTSKIKTLSSQKWYGQCGNVTLMLLLEEDPFKYNAGGTTLSEDQWAAGLCSDVFAYAGYSFLSASYESGVEDGTAFAKGKAAVLKANGYAQFTDYLHAEANVKVAYAEGEAKIGFSDKYKGFKVKAEVGLIKADGSVVLGSDDLNAFIKGEAKVLCADGKVAFEFEEDGQYAIGVDASATLASASVKGGTTLIGYKNKDLATGETETLLGFKVGAKADAGGSFALWAESKTAIETDIVNINATTLKVDAAALLGVDVSITIPTLHFKWPW